MLKSLVLYICLLTLVCTSLRGQIEAIAADTEISLLTCKSGDELYSTFAHTALRVHNTKTQSDIVFNYGVFDFSTPYFYIKFLRGLLPYKLAATSMDRFLRAYQYEQRTVIEQKLNLTTEQKAALISSLAENIKPENAEYAYDFFFDNCTTRTDQVITQAVGSINYSVPVEEITYRAMLKEHLMSMPWSEFGIDLIIGAVADQQADRAQQHFLPTYLYEDYNHATLATDSTTVPLASTDYIVLDFEEKDKERKTSAPPWPTILAMALLALELLLLWKRPRIWTAIYDKTWMILLGSMAVVMAVMWWGTAHMATKQNYNLLWASLLFIPYLWTSSKAFKHVLAAVIVGGSIVTMANSMYQFLPQYFHPAFGIMALISVLKLTRQWSQRAKP